MAESREMTARRDARRDARRLWRCAFCGAWATSASAHLAHVELRHHVEVLHPRGGAS